MVGAKKMAYQTFQQEYLQIPVVTRAYTTACVLTTAAVVRNVLNNRANVKSTAFCGNQERFTHEVVTACSVQAAELA